MREKARVIVLSFDMKLDILPRHMNEGKKNI